jgi:hypothetical protein
VTDCHAAPACAWSFTGSIDSHAAGQHIASSSGCYARTCWSLLVGMQVRLLCGRSPAGLCNQPKFHAGPVLRAQCKIERTMSTDYVLSGIRCTALQNAICGCSFSGAMRSRFGSCPFRHNPSAWHSLPANHSAQNKSLQQHISKMGLASKINAASAGGGGVGGSLSCRWASCVQICCACKARDHVCACLVTFCCALAPTCRAARCVQQPDHFWSRTCLPRMHRPSCAPGMHFTASNLWRCC